MSLLVPLCPRHVNSISAKLKDSPDDDPETKRFYLVLIEGLGKRFDEGERPCGICDEAKEPPYVM